MYNFHFCSVFVLNLKMQAVGTHGFGGLTFFYHDRLSFSIQLHCFVCKASFAPVWPVPLWLAPLLCLPLLCVSLMRTKRSTNGGGQSPGVGMIPIRHTWRI
jgi:hypothetical protein